MNASIFVREKHAEVFNAKQEMVLELFKILPSSKQVLLVGNNFYGTQNFVNKFKISILKFTIVGCKLPVVPIEKTYRSRPKR